MVTHIIRGNECILFPLSLSTTLEMDVTEAAAVKQGWQLWWTSMTIKTYKVRESRTTTLVSPSQWFPLCNHPHPHCPSAHLEPAYQYFSRQSEILRFCQSELMFKCHMTSGYPVSLSLSPRWRYFLDRLFTPTFNHPRMTAGRVLTSEPEVWY